MKEKVDILVVDDLKENHLVMESILEDEGVNIVKAMSGEEALEKCRKSSFAVILMDVQMPGLDGFQTAELLRRVEKTKRIPIIFVTAISKEQNSIFKGYEVGAVDYLFKPINPIILRSKVRIFRDMYSQQKQLEDMKENLEKKVAELEAVIAERNQLEDISNEDFLTNMYNRRGIDRLLDIQWKNCLKYGIPISFIMIDIDHFKKYNDKYGHPQGDMVLQKVADQIKCGLRRTQDFAGRHGGEEFLVVLPSTPLIGAEIVAERIKEFICSLEIEHLDNENRNIVTASMGVSSIVPKESIDLEYVLNRTDEMLYNAKKSGRNKYISINLKEDIEENE